MNEHAVRNAVALRAVILLFGLGLAVHAQQNETIVVSEATKAETVAEIGVDPEPDLNCHIAFFPRAGIAGIVPSDAEFTEGTARQRHLAKRYFTAGVLKTSGQINQYYTTGTLAGVEFDWFLEDNFEPSPGYLPVRAEFVDSTGAVVCYMYCYDLAGYLARHAELEAMLGHPMYYQRVWAGAGVRGTDSHGHSEIKKDDNEIRGVFAAPKVKIDKHGNNLPDGVEYVDHMHLHHGNTVGSTTQVASIATLAMPWTESEARALAQTSGTYYASNVTFNSCNPPPSGFVFGDGDIKIDVEDFISTTTFVARKKIELKGDRNTFTCHTAHALFVSYDGDIKIKSKDNVLEGECLTVKKVKVEKDRNTIHGIVQGKRVSIKSKENFVSDGTH